MPENNFIANIRCFYIWKKRTGKHINSTILYIGKILVAHYFFDGMRSKDDPLCYKAASLINSGTILGSFRTTEECEIACIEYAKKFCQMLKGV